MMALLEIAVNNALVASALAAVVFAASRCCSRPALMHTLWVIVLLKLLTPPLWQFELFAATEFLFASNVTKHSPPTTADRPAQHPLRSQPEQSISQLQNVSTSDADPVPPLETAASPLREAKWLSIAG